MVGSRSVVSTSTVTDRPTSPSTAALRRRCTPTPLEHYAYWQEDLGEKLPFGAFGENLTVEGLPLEHEGAVGDRFRVGSAELVVTQPRLPCYKLGRRFGREEMVKQFLLSGRTGCYLAVTTEGEVGAGDAIETVAHHPARIPVAEITRVYASDRDDLATLERLIALDARPNDWRSDFRSGSCLRDALTVDPARRKEHEMHTHDKPASFHSSPQEALRAPPEEFLYLACLHRGTGVEQPDFIAVVDAEQGRVVHETPMPSVGDELHHFGWNRCSSACHGPDRSHLILPGFRSSRIHILNVADDPRRPRIEKVIQPEEVVRKTGYTRPHTTHCMPGGNVVVSMLGDAEGNGACGFAVLDAESFELKGRWEDGGETPSLNYDFWYQPRKNVLLSSEFGEPNAYEPGFDLADVEAGRYGHRLHFWNLAERKLEQTVDLGESGLLPFEVRWKHDPEAEEGFVGAALSSTMWRFRRDNGGWAADQVIAVEPVELEGWPFPVPGVMSDLVLSMDDRFLYFSNWLHGDLRQYDVSDPANPKLTGRLWLGGLLGKPSDAGRELNGGPQMLQLSFDGRRLYVSNSLYSTWDNQFYPELRSWLLRVNCGPNGGMEVDRDFFVDLHDRPAGPARAHEVHLQNGDCTTEIFQ